MENTEDRENVENVEPEDRPTDQVPTPPEMAVKYGSFMEQCFDIATTVMETHEMMEDEGIDRPLQSSIAFRIFDRCTRETSGLETMVQMAMSYLSMMLQDKAAESKRLANLPPMPIFGAVVAVAECKHPGLRALYEHLDVIRPSPDLAAGLDREKAGGADAAAEIIQAMRLETGAETGAGALLCSHCRALVPVDKVTSGELWSDEADESEEEEEETESVSPVGLDFARRLSSAVCEHPVLKLLYLYNDTLDIYGDPYRLLSEIISVMTLEGVEDQSFLLCPHCRSLIPFEAFESGVAWSDSAEASRKAAREEDDPKMEVVLLQRHRTAGRPAEEFGKTPVDFYREVDAVHRIAGLGTVTIYKRESAGVHEQVGKATTEEVIRDRDFLEGIRKEHGDGVYRFTISKSSGDKLSQHDFIIGEVDEKELKRKKKT